MKCKRDARTGRNPRNGEVIKIVAPQDSKFIAWRLLMTQLKSQFLAAQ